MKTLLKDTEFWRMLDLMAHKRPNDHPNKEFIAKYGDKIAAARIAADMELGQSEQLSCSTCIDYGNLTGTQKCLGCVNYKNWRAR
jgi:hypothetical protein